MFPITLTLHNIAELKAVLAVLDQTPVETLAYKVTEQSKEPAAAPVGKPSGARTAPSPRTAAAAPSTPAPSDAAPAPAPTATPTAAAASSAGEVPYSDVQKAVAKLYAKDAKACQEIPATFGLATYKDLQLPEHTAKRQAVLDAVNAKLAELGVA